jgi:hypothetical protein
MPSVAQAGCSVAPHTCPVFGPGPVMLYKKKYIYNCHCYIFRRSIAKTCKRNYRIFLISTFYVQNVGFWNRKSVEIMELELELFTFLV